MYWKTFCEKPYVPNLEIIKSWRIMSKVFDMSMNEFEKWGAIRARVGGMGDVPAWVEC